MHLARCVPVGRCSILIVEIIIGVIAMRRTLVRWHAVVILTLFPASLAFVATLEAMGYD